MLFSAPRLASLLPRCRPLVAKGTPLLRMLGLAVLVGMVGRPASAELRVRVSKPVTGKWQSVGITVTDPRQGLDAKPGPIAVTMADGRDRRQTVYLHPTGRPGNWSGRYTPVSTGRFTGTAVLEREHDKDLGLVPLVRVQPSNARGFVRRHARSRRALQYSNGGTLFPIPVRIAAEDLLRISDWHAEVARLRAHDVNFVEVPVSWPETQSKEIQEQALGAVDQLLLEAERTGRLAVLLRLEAPQDVSGTGADAYREQLGRWTRRWAYSPALAAWYVTGANDTVDAETRASFVRAVRQVDSYNHLVAINAADGAVGVGDLTVAPFEWQRPSNRYSLLEAQPAIDVAAPLPGEDTWQSLVIGGVGLPIQPYQPGTPEGEATLRRIAQLARAAGKVPYQTYATPVTGLVSADTPGSFYRYGKAVVGWVAPDGEHTFALPRLAAGRYQLSLWDPARDRFLDDSVLQFDGGQRRMKLPESLAAVYFMLRPAGRASAPSKPTRVAAAPKPAALARPAPRPVWKPKPIWKPKPVVKPGFKPRGWYQKRWAPKPKPVVKSKRGVRVKPVPKPKPLQGRGKVKVKPALKPSKRRAKGQPRGKKAPAKKPAAVKSRKAAKRPAPKKAVARASKARKAPVAARKRSVKRKR